MITSGDWYRDERAQVSSSTWPYQSAPQLEKQGFTPQDHSQPPIHYDPYQVNGFKPRPSIPDFTRKHAPRSNYSYAPSSNYSYAPLSNQSYAPSSNLSHDPSSNMSHVPFSNDHEHNRSGPPPSRSVSVDKIKKKHLPATQVSGIIYFNFHLLSLTIDYMKFMLNS